MQFIFVNHPMPTKTHLALPFFWNPISILLKKNANPSYFMNKFLSEIQIYSCKIKSAPNHVHVNTFK